MLKCYEISNYSRIPAIREWMIYGSGYSLKPWKIHEFEVKRNDGFILKYFLLFTPQF